MEAWPEQDRFPVNRPGYTVGAVIRADLIGSRQPLLVAGYSSIAQLVEFIAAWSQRQPDGHVRILLGTEPHPTTRDTFTSATIGFTEEVRGYWLRRGISLHLSATVIHALDALTAERVTVKFVHGPRLLHAKVYVGDTAAAAGSSNFTHAGLGAQTEVNTRFTTDTEPDRHRELTAAGDHLWALGEDWTPQFRALLEDLLQVVGWEDALARACADLLDGDWAAPYLPADTTAGGLLWPSQRAGIAQALWILRESGSVLIADATGSGKTRLGAHLIRAVQDRLRAGGRQRRDLAVLTCPSAVSTSWDSEAVACGAQLRISTHHQLSSARTATSPVEDQALVRAQILAVDEAHNFLNRHSARTRQLRTATADHVLLFTATPINRGPLDLLALVDHLGADNFDDAVLSALSTLGRRSSADQVLSPAQRASLRDQIARFTVRRTKTMLNALVDRDPAAYTDPDGHRCRYPVHETHLYDTGETPADIALADRIRAVTATLTGIGGLKKAITVPEGVRGAYSAQQWLDLRVSASRGLVAHQVLEALRSSRAALVEHLAGTAAAVTRFGLDSRFKTTSARGQIAELHAMGAAGPPVVPAGTTPPDWLVDPDRWAAQCAAEADRHSEIVALVGQLSDTREQTKAGVIADLAAAHPRVLAFDHRLITLAALAGHLQRRGVDAMVAVGGNDVLRHRVEARFARDATGDAVALCSDAFNEGLNLQGASALVHLDLLTTVRAVEQRVGRIDRMNTRHSTIEVWWPRDTPAFATRANELLLRRTTQSEELLGSNVAVPDFTAAGALSTGDPVEVEDLIRRLDTPTEEPWDGIRDVFDSVTRLINGPDPLITAAVYAEHRSSAHQILARVSPLQTRRPWVFLAVAASDDRAPRWQFLDGPDLHPVGDLDAICGHLRTELAAHPTSQALDDDAQQLLDRALVVAAAQEFTDLPRRSQQALHQMDTVLRAWAAAQRRSSFDEDPPAVFDRLARLARPGPAGTLVDPHLVVDQWLGLIAARVDAYRSAHPAKPYTLLSDITPGLLTDPLPLTDLRAAFDGLPTLTPLADRVSACILGVPIS